MAVDLSGTQGYLTKTGTIGSDAPEFSLCGWIKREADGGDDYIASQLDTFNGAGYIFFIDDVSSISSRTNVLRITFYEGGGADDKTLESPSNAISLNTWYHVCFTMEKATADTGLRLYIDGIAVADSPVDATTLTDWTLTANFRFNLGRYTEDTTNSRMFTGKLSEFAIWDKILTPDEVTLLANARVKGLPLQIQSANLLAYYPLDDISDGSTIVSATFKDRSGNDNDMTGVDAGSVSVSAAEEVLSYPVSDILVTRDAGVPPVGVKLRTLTLMGAGR